MRPVTTGHDRNREHILNRHQNGFSTSRFGIGMYRSISATSFTTAGTPISLFVPFQRFSADPITIGVSSSESCCTVYKFPDDDTPM